MSVTGINSDFSKTVIIRTAEIEWQKSPSPNVWRKRLDLAGPLEAGRVTSIVRYDPESEFTSHSHPLGEEIFVLEGVFSDEYGNYPAGTFLLNPEGFSHAPFSKDGCVIFVKLRQYPGVRRKQVIIDTKSKIWQPTRFDGIDICPLYEEKNYPENIHLTRFSPGTYVPNHSHPGGEEILVLSGIFCDELGEHGEGSWLRYPIGSCHSDWSNEGCVIYVKNNHLPDETRPISY